MAFHSEIDEIDLKIMDLLQRDCRISNVEIGKQVNVSPPTVHARMKRLRQLGYISGFVAHLEAKKLGYDLRCVIHINLQTHHIDDVYFFRDQIARIPEVLLAYQTTGEFDYVLIVIVENQEKLSAFIMEKLTQFKSIARIQTSIVLTEIKSTTSIPLPQRE